MKKILILMIAFVAIACVPQVVNAQNDVEPIKEKELTKEQIEKAAVKKEEVAKNAEKTKQTKSTPVKKEGPKMEETAKKTVPQSKNQPREAIITPIKNPKNNKVVVGKKIEKDKKGKNKKKLHKVQF